jgi:flagellar biosynthesis protein
LSLAWSALVSSKNAGPQDRPAPTRQAVVLTYEQGEYAPRVVAQGRGVVAEQIIARAKEHKIFVHKSKELVGLLMKVDLDDHIPAALYLAIAELLAWIYRLENTEDICKK